jgi:hypothetical protein
MQDTGKFRTNTKDQFYTRETIAKHCIDTLMATLPESLQYVWLEPSAGNGSFLHNIPDSCEKIGMDIEPKSPDIVQQDYLNFQWSPRDKKVLVVGNPPFGRQSALAKAFITKSCSFADVIAFILPKSFTKPSMSNAFDKYFHCIHSEEIEKNAFIINGLPHDVPCVFQIWQKKTNIRNPEQKILPIGFDYVKENYDIAFRRVGGLAGKR